MMSEFDQNQQGPGAPPPAPDQAPPQYGAPPPPPQYGAPPPPQYGAPPPPPQYGAPPPQYGAPPPYGQPVYVVELPTHMPSLILGIVALVGLWFTIGLAGVICGGIGIGMARKAKLEYKTTAGFVMSLIGLIIGIIVLLVWVAIFAVAGAAFGALGSLLY